MAKQKSLQGHMIDSPMPFVPEGGRWTAADAGVGVGTAMGAAFDDAWATGSVNSLNRIITSEILGSTTRGKTGYNEVVPFGVTKEQHYADVQGMGAWVPYKDAIKEINQAGFTHVDVPISDQGVNRDILKVVIDAAKEQRVRRGYIERGERDYSISMMGAGFAASIVDPIDLLASVVIPTTNLARARHLAKFKPLFCMDKRRVVYLFIQWNVAISILYYTCDVVWGVEIRT